MANVLKIKNNDTWETNINKIYKKVDNVWVEQDNNNWVNLFDLNFKYQRYSATPTAVLYSDGTLIFSDNEYIREGVHGDVVETYTGWDTEHYNKQSVLPWFNQLTQITNVYINYINPRYTRNWFNSCALTSFNFNHFDTSNVISMESMFETCSRLTSLNLSGFNTSNVVSMSNMFHNCRNLTSLDLSDFDTSKVTNMSHMFGGCDNLASLDLSGFDTNSVANMGNMFNNCTNLTSLNLSNFDTSKVTNMSSMFSDCTNLTSLNLSNFNTNSITEMSYMFSNCDKLIFLNLSSFAINYNVITNNMFLGCTNLQTIYVKDETAKTKIESSTGFPTGVSVIIRNT